MSKRRLTQRQNEQIQSRQQQQKDRILKKTTHLLSQASGEELHGQIIARHGIHFIVENNTGQLQNCMARQNLGNLVCGDRVIWQKTGDNAGVITVLLDRTSLIERHHKKNTKPIAANIDQIIIVSAIEPPIQTNLINRYLVSAELLKIAPVIVINKIDLLKSEQKSQFKSIKNTYSKLNYPVFEISTHLNKGFNQLHQYLANKTSILVGQSGVGKSSIIQHILPNHSITIGQLSELSGLGKHTTSATTLYHMPLGGHLIDSPGIRQFGLWHHDAEEITCGFKEFKPLIGHCKFSNCTHLHEPGCKIIEAVQTNNIERCRYQSYMKILAD